MFANENVQDLTEEIFADVKPGCEDNRASLEESIVVEFLKKLNKIGHIRTFHQDKKWP